MTVTLPEGLRIERSPSGQADPLAERSYQYNVAQTGYTDGQKPDLTIRDADHTEIGALRATTWAG